MSTPILTTKTRLFTSTTFYVDPSGSDAGPGDASHPFGNPIAAYDYLKFNVDANDMPISVVMSDSLGYGRLAANGPIQGVNDPLKLQFIGNLAHPDHVVLDGGGSNNSIIGYNGAKLSFSGLLMNNPGSCLEASGSGTKVVIGPKNVFDTCSTFHINSTLHANISGVDSYDLIGNAYNHFSMSAFGIVDIEMPTLTNCNVVGTRTFNTFCLARAGGGIDSKRTTWNGGIIRGKRFYIASACWMHTEAANPALYFPGDLDGVLGIGAEQS